MKSSKFQALQTHRDRAGRRSLAKWLDDHRCRCIFQARGGDSMCEQWRTPNGRVFMVIVHSDGHGWDLATFADTNSIHDTLRDAEARLGLPLVKAFIDSLEWNPGEPGGWERVLPIAEKPKPQPSLTGPFKVCSCGKAFTLREWGKLRLVGNSHVFDEEGVCYCLEQRDCPCGSSIAVRWDYNLTEN